MADIPPAPPRPAWAMPNPPPDPEEPPEVAPEVLASASAIRDLADGNAHLLTLTGVPSAKLRDIRNDPAANLRPLFQRLIREAAPLVGSIDNFYDTENPNISKNTGWSRKGTKTYNITGRTGRNVTLDVDLLTKKIRAAGQSGSEAWACRRSNHMDSRTDGTASWNEFYAYMKHEHVQTELDMMDTVVEGKIWEFWDKRTMLPITEVGPAGSKWSDFTLAIIEMEHDIGQLFDNRVFPVLQMTCQNEPSNEYWIISVPIGHWLEWKSAEGKLRLAEQDKVVVGSYASVEVFRRVLVPENPRTLQRKGSKVREILTRRLSKKSRASQVGLSGVTGAGASSAGAANDDPSASAPAEPVRDTGAADAAAAKVMTPAAAAPIKTAPGEASSAPGEASGAPGEASGAPGEASSAPEDEYRIEWIMATTSHARGRIPLILQTPAVPSKIAEDVPVFIRWMAAKRQEIAEIHDPVIRDVGGLLSSDNSAPPGAPPV